MNVRLRFLLAFAFTVLLWAGYTPAPSTLGETAIAYVLGALALVAFLMIIVAIFHAAECSDGRATGHSRPRGHDYYPTPRSQREREPYKPPYRNPAAPESWP